MVTPRRREITARESALLQIESALRGSPSALIDQAFDEAIVSCLAWDEEMHEKSDDFDQLLERIEKRVHDCLIPDAVKQAIKKDLDALSLQKYLLTNLAARNVFDIVVRFFLEGPS